MEFYRNLFIHFFNVNNIGLQLLDILIEENEDRAFEYITENIKKELSKEEIERYYAWYLDENKNIAIEIESQQIIDDFNIEETDTKIDTMIIFDELGYNNIINQENIQSNPNLENRGGENDGE